MTDRPIAVKPTAAFLSAAATMERAGCAIAIASLAQILCER
jgi:hypothetical protein